MRKVTIFAALAALLFLFPPTTRAQNADPVEKLRTENERLKREVERLKREIELPKKESNPGGAATMPTLSTEALEKAVRAVLLKAEEERWLEIPWRTNLMEARAEAQEKGRPLFLWVMEGNPLGCT